MAYIPASLLISRFLNLKIGLSIAPWLCFLVAWINFSNTYGQTFADSSSFALPDWNLQGLYNATLEWGDYDNDGDYDLFIMGDSSSTEAVTTLYINTGGVFSEDLAAKAVFTDVSSGDISLNDFNLDGFADVFISGKTPAGTNVSNLYRNNGVGGFVLEGSASALIENVENGASDWGDYDNDGDEDLILIGLGGGGQIIRIYENQGGGIFASDPDAVTGLTAVSSGDIHWFDANADGFLDIISTGFTGASGSTQLAINSGNGTFSVIATGITNVRNSKIDIGDYDNDGDEDILIAGQKDDTGLITEIIKNDGNNTFSTSFTTIGIQNGSLQWGDINEDGFLDMIVSGATATGTGDTLEIYQNNGVGGFVALSPTIPPISLGSVNWGDYNGNGTLDLAIAGLVLPDTTATDTIPADTIFSLYENQVTPIANVISAPGNLSALQAGSNITFSWDDPPSYPVNSLNFVFSLSQVSTESDLSSPLSDLTTGQRRLIQRGKLIGNSLTIRGLSPGTYYWNVQGINRQFEGTGFATEQILVVQAPDFVDTTNSVFSFSPDSIDRSFVAWADYDNDDDLDLLILGESSAGKLTKIYKNDGNTFLDSGIGLEQISDGEGAWGDFDADGDLDLLLTGSSGSGAKTVLYRNDNGTFTSVASSFSQLEFSSADWGDFDKDGDMDLLLAGEGAGGKLTEVYRNDGGGTFTNLNLVIDGISGGIVRWADVNNNGFLDFLESGTANSGGISRVFKNDGNGGFGAIGSLIGGLTNSHGDWGDYDNDGDLDIVLSGNDGSVPKTTIYRNNGNESFSNSGISLTGVEDGTSLWGDFNNDGLLDLLITGKSGSGIREYETKLYKQGPIGTFTEDDLNTPALTMAGKGSSAVWGDYDNNGKLDILLTGQDTSGNRIFTLFNNTESSPTSSPEVPIDLSSLQQGNEVVLSWDIPGSVPASIRNGLSYNIFIGTTVNSVNVKPPHSSIQNGFRKYVRQGNSKRQTFTINSLTTGTYYWSVQSVEQDFEGSGFAAVDSFTYVIPDFLDSTANIFTAIPSGLREADLNWVDYDNDDDLDLFITGNSSTGITAGLYNNNNGSFSFVPSSISGVRNGQSLWYDLDNDGDLDLLISGESTSGPISKVYRNDGGGSFTEIASGLPGRSNSGLAIGDFDQDGDADVLLLGRENGSSPQTQLFQNDGSAIFSAVNENFVDVEDGEAEWVDLNKDGLLDLIIIGRSNAGPVSRIYSNTGPGIFNEVSSGLINLEKSSLDIADFNGDDLPDLLLAGSDGLNSFTKVYQNTGDFNFQDFGGASNLPGISEGSVAWGDYDNDGFADILITGTTSTLGRISQIFHNDNANSFNFDASASVLLRDANNGSVGKWGDYNKDGNLDVGITGQSSSGPGYSFQILKNIKTLSPSSPGVPSNLVASQNGDKVELSWSSGTQVPASPAERETYQLYIGTSTRNGQILGPQSNILTGFRKIAMGGTINQTFSTIRGLPTGNYFWGVQAIGVNHLGSAFSAEGTFSYVAPEFQEVTGKSFLQDPPQLNSTGISWGDYDNDDDLDFVIMGRNEAGQAITEVYENENGFFTRDGTASNAIDGVFDGDLEWGDYDNDGDLDLLISGNTGSGSSTKVYRNEGSSQFIDLGLGLPDLYSSSLAWGDFNNDGSLDFVITGTNGAEKIGRVFSNRFISNPSNPFTEARTISGVTDGVVEWSDMDVDGDLDFILLGEGSSLLSEIYENQGNGTFNVIEGAARGIIPLKDCDADWGDYNNDGLPDLVLSGLNTAGVPFLFYSFNNGGLTFSSTNITGISGGDVSWGDYNDDGYLDIAASGKNILGQRVSKIYQNSGGLLFAESSLNSSVLTEVDSGSVIQWVDFDKDNKLDLFVAGSQTASKNFFGIYKNYNAEANRVSLAPENLQSLQIGNLIELSWDPPAAYPPALIKGLTYNLYIGSSNNSENLKAASSTIPGGFRKLVKMGNVHQSTTFPLKDLSGGTYFWSVQSVDQDFEGSPFAAEESFTFSPPTFLDVTTTALGNNPKGLDLADLSWADYDNDGDLDLIAIGDEGPVPSTVIYRNDAGVFNNSGISLPFIQDGKAVWADYNQDGFVDLLLTGTGLSGRTSQLYTNNNGSGFSPEGVGLTQLGMSAGDFADFDNDGDLDLIMIGTTGGSNYSTILYRNDLDESGSFTIVNTTMPGIRNGFVKWADYNNDGWVDVLLSGLTSSGSVTQLFRNDTNGGFVDSGFSLIGVSNSDGEWADYDNDGDLDFIIGGDLGATPNTLLYRNELAGNSFTLVASSLPGISEGSLRWGDYNDDGFYDLLISGKISGGRTTSLYTNDGAGGFTEDAVSSDIIEDVNNGSIAIWGDFDGNNTLDIALAGNSASGRNISLIKNLLSPANNKIPLPPENLIASQVDDKIVLKWSPPSSGDPSLINGYTYNLFVGETSSSEEYRASMSNLQNGYRKIVSLGNLFQGDSLVLENISPGTYSWSIQSIDQDFEGSSFAELKQFNYFEPSFVNQTSTAFASAPSGLSEAAMSWGDYDNDNDLDLFISGESASGAQSILFENNSGTLSNSGVAIPALRNGSAKWGEYDNDDLPDLLLTGISGGGRLSAVFRNNGNQSFSNVASLTGVSRGDANWADYDNDGDFDIALIGESDGGLIANIYRNDNGTFVDINASLLPVINGICIWGDYDNDGDQDLLISGESSGGGVDAVLYENLGKDNFQDSGVPIEGFKDSDGVWGDINNDGWLDLVLAGDNGSGQFTKIFTNQDGSSFNELDVIEGIALGAIALGDYNEDGYRDLAISGTSNGAPGDLLSRIYSNDNGNDFVIDLDAGAALPQLENSDLSWIDYDGNGKLDLLLSGNASSGSFRLNMFRNITLNVNTIPQKPVQLSARQRGEVFEFSWEPNGNTDPGIAEGQTYNVYVGSQIDGGDIANPLANTGNGFRKILDLGNVGHVKKWSINGLEPGNYFWGVQAIDADWEGSDFSSGGEFSYIPPDFVDRTQEFFGSVPPGWKFVSIAPGDYDNDNDLDLLISGEEFGQDKVVLFENQGGNFTNSGLTFSNLSNGEVKWEDFNNDGWIDLMLTGVSPSGPATDLYINNQNGSFDSFSSSLPGVKQGSFDWGDFDNDGDRDVVITGENSSGQNVTEIFLNDGSGNLSQLDTSIPGIINGQVRWGDLDDDKDIDLAITGESSQGAITKIYENRRNGSLIEIENPLDGNFPLQALSSSRLSWGDTDNDGFIDLIVSGRAPSGEKVIVYKNNGNKTFSVLQEIDGVSDGDLELGDYNNDGWLDFLMTGRQGSATLAMIYQNSTFGDFNLDVTNSGVFQPLRRRADLAWADLNNNGKLDIILAGQTQDGTDELRIYQNIETTPNQSPNPPENLSGFQSGQAVSLSWDPPAGANPATVNGLSYNLYIGTSPSSANILSPMANIPGGGRRVVFSGKIPGNSFELLGLEEGTYYWSVQAIDQDFEGSAFAAEGVFEFSPPDLLDITSFAFPQGEPLGLSSADISWADFDSDSDLDLLIMGETENGPSTTLFRNNGNGTFLNSGIQLEAVKDGSAAWGDYDNNGLIDLAISGDNGNGRILYIYDNNINSFSLVEQLDGLSIGEIEWGDYDNDGDPDLLVAGAQNNSGPVKIYENDNGNFQPINLNIGSPSNCSIDWGDYDNDGFLDFVFAGNTGIGALTEIRRNNGNGSFANIQAVLTGANNASVEWGDYNNDGLLDLVVSGNLANTLFTKIYQNEGNNNFTETFTLTGVREGVSRWGDFNDDGFLDLLIVGKSGSGGGDRTSRLFINDAGNDFILDTLNSFVLPDLDQGAAASWADFDKDGKLDLAIAGRSSGNGPQRSFRLFKNANSQSNQSPPEPENLQVDQVGNQLFFTWELPQGVSPERAGGLSYNLYLGSNPGVTNIRSPLSKENGFRQVSRRGAINTLSWVVNGLDAGDYYWSVQSIDQDFEGSSFASEEQFSFNPPDFVNITTNGNLETVFQDLDDASLAWGDFDNDRDLDLLATGVSNDGIVSSLYENRGGGNFDRRAIIPDSVANGQIAWSDYNNDGFLDFIMTGESRNGPISKVFRNTRTGGFVDIDAGIRPLMYSSASWGDVDNDGDQDLLLSGEYEQGGNTQLATLLYLNSGRDRFIAVESNFEAVSRGKAGFVDYDNDGLLDVFVSGTSVSGPVAALYKNQGNRSFVPVNTDIKPLGRSTFDWGDYDNNGFDDLAISGLSSLNERNTFIYLNNEGNGFSQVDSLTGTSDGSIAWGDFNEDGFLDLLLNGNTDGPGENRTFRLYRNNRTGGLVNDVINSEILVNIDNGSKAIWGDYDNDGKLDIISTGKSSDGPTLRSMILYRNTISGIQDNTPGVPVIIGEDRLLEKVVLKWNPPSGAVAKGYTYNVYVGVDQQQDISVVSPLSSLNDGTRRVVYQGNVGHNTQIELFGLPTGNYWWSVQAIDQEFEGSAFASPDSFFYNSPLFIDVSTSAMPLSALSDIKDGDFDWGDYDNDGDLDMIVVGLRDTVPFTTIYKNNGSIGFTEVQDTLPGLREAAVAWGDLDNNGFLDVTLTGDRNGEPQTLFFLNDGIGGFTDVSESQGLSLQGFRSGSIEWGDFTNDGYDDLVLTGFTEAGPTSRVYANNRQGGLIELQPIVGVFNGDASFGDFNGDGFLDLAVVGFTGSDLIGVVLENKLENGIFNAFETENSISNVIANVSGGNVAWADYDNDGDLDLLVTGDNGLSPITKLYRNLGDKNFEDTNFEFVGITEGMGAWGDYNEDGYADLILSGRSGTEGTDRATRLYQFDPDAQNFFADTVASSLLTNANAGAKVAFGDYNRDGKIDLLLTGKTNDSPDQFVLKLFKNQDISLDSIPEPPSNLLADNLFPIPGGGFSLTLSWDPPDTTELSKGYSYNLVFGAENSETFRKSPLADTLSGFRRVYRLGNVNQTTSWTITGLPEGRFYWSVQSVDQDFEASSFAPFDEVIIEIQSFADVSGVVFTSPPLAVGEGSLIWGDADNDGDLDIFSTGEIDENNVESSLYLNDNRTGKFTRDQQASEIIKDFKRSDAAWGDFNLDGFIDLLICGEDINGNHLTEIYRNLKNGNFVLDTLASSTLVDVADGAVDWGDFDNDGDPDILITGRPESGGPITRIYRNLGNGKFADYPNPRDSFVGVDQGDVEWGDYDKDGNLDFVITGRDNANNPLTEVYNNEGNGEFVSISSSSPAPITDVKESTVAWGDHNNDGYLDLFLAGEETKNDFRPVTRFYFYDTLNRVFTERVIPGLVDIKNGQLAWGDYNEDGFQDLLISGQTSDTSRTTRIYQNNKGQGFSQDLRSSSILQDIGQGQSSWGDYNGDGKLDVILSGVSNTEPKERSFTLYQNIDTAFNKPVFPPLNPTASIVGDEVTLRWNPPQVNPTVRNGFTYNVYVSRVSDSVFRKSGEADTLSGKRRIVRMGNTGHTNTWTLKSLIGGNYCWGVQTVGADFQGSLFARSSQCFSYVPPVPQIADSFFADTFIWNDPENTAESWIRVVDNDKVGQVKLYYKRISSPNWTIIDVDEVSGTQYILKNFTTKIDPFRVDNEEIGLEYFFEVTSRFFEEFVVRTDTHYTYIEFKQNDNYNVDGLAIPELQDGPNQEDYNIISVPLVLKDSTISGVLDELGDYNIDNWRIFQYNGERNAENIARDNQGFNHITDGNGYWLIVRELPGAVHTGEGVTVRSNDAKPYIIPLRQGFNQIGNPFNFNISWTDILNANPGNITRNLDQLWTYSLGYQSSPVIRRFRGGFIFSDSTMNLSIPVRKNLSIQRFSTPGNPSILENPIHLSSWRVDINLSSAGKSYPFGGFGMHKLADESKDEYDWMLPPRISGNVDMSFKHPEYFYPFFTRDIVGTQESYIWEFTVHSSLGQNIVELEWANHYYGLSDRQLILMDLEDQKVVDMREQDIYAYFSDKPTRSFRIYFGDQQFIDDNLSPDKLVLGIPFPNPAKEWVKIPFSLPEAPGQSDYNVNLLIYNTLGQKVAGIEGMKLEAGFHFYDWKLNGLNGQKVPPGTYIYSIRVNNGLQAQQASGRIIIEP